MDMALGRVRAFLRTPGTSRPALRQARKPACAWDVLRSTYEEQAARGIPQAIEGLERIEQGRWPSSGRRRERARAADG